MTNPQTHAVERVVFDAETADNYPKDEEFVKTVENDSIYVLDKFVQMCCSIPAAKEPFEVPICNHYLLLQPSSGKPAWLSPTLPETSGFVFVSPEEMKVVLQGLKPAE